MTLGLEPGQGAESPSASDARLVEVAVDAAGAAGARTYTYLVPDELADLEPGEAVLVEFGRRQALGIVLGEGGPAPAGVLPKPIVERVRADGPLLPPLSLGLARWIANHYLAPPALVLRAMLPPGMLERLELVAERVPGGTTRRPTWAGSNSTCSISSPQARRQHVTWPPRKAGPGSCDGSVSSPDAGSSPSTGRSSPRRRVRATNAGSD